MFKKTSRRLTSFIQRLPATVKIILIVDAVLVIVLLSGFFFPKSVQFSYGGSNCVKELTLLPNLNHVRGDSAFSVERIDSVSIGGYDLISLQTCFTAKEAPRSGEYMVSVSPFGGWFAQRDFRVVVPEPPVVDASGLSQPIPTARALSLPISQSDKVFGYRLVIGNDAAVCNQNKNALHCDVASLQLTQGKKYTAQIIRYFEKEVVETIVDKEIATLVATSVKKSSISNKQVVYSEPSRLTVQFDKKIVNVSAELHQIDGGKKTKIVTSTKLTGDTLEVAFKEELARKKQFKLVVTNVEAVDGSTLSDPYEVVFSTSGGPKVSGINIGSSKVGLTATVTVTFDQAIDQKQDISKLAILTGISSVVSRGSNWISFSYSNAGRCTDHGVTIKKGIESKYGIVSDSDWYYAFRTICHTISTIGYSVQGRAITAYTFGNGTSTVLYTGTIHGNEYGARALMFEWIDELEAHPEKIPSNKKVIVVPVINPDGVIASQRYNAHTVDLNRNFDTNDWKKDVVTPANEPLPGGGGSAPMSEPETKAIASFTTSLRPRLTLSFHGAAGYAIGNMGGDSKQLAAKYSALSGYSDQTGKSDTAFDYAITGTYDDWIREKLGLPSVLIELTSNSYSEFSRNQAALWAMVNA